MTQTLQPEFGEANFIDNKVNPDYTVTLTPTANWYQEDKKFLYDHRADKLLYSNGADDDVTEVVIEVDFQQDIFFDMLKILNCNFKNYTIQVKPDGGVYSTVQASTLNALSKIQYYNPVAFEDYGYLQGEDGDFILDESFEKLELDYGDSLVRYVKITCTETFLVNDEKYLGELYIGQRAFKISEGKVLDYRENNRDFRKQIFPDFFGVATVVRGKNVYNATLVLQNMDLDETTFIKNIVENGGIYDFFPTGSDYGTDLDNSLSIDDIYYVTTKGSWNPHAWRTKGSNRITLQLLETKYVS